MAKSSILGGEHVPEHATGKGTDLLGPSDNSDSGSDAQGAYGEGELNSDSDAAGTGERASIEGMDRSNADVLPDRVQHDPDASAVDDLGDTDVESVDDLALSDEAEEDDESDSADRNAVGS